MTRLRIVQILPEFVIGGAERLAVELAIALRSAGHDVSVVSLFGPRRTALEAMLAGAAVPVHFLDKRMGWDVRLYGRLREVVRRLDPDIVHTHQTVLRYALPVVVTGRRCRMIHTVHALAQHEVDGWGRVLQFGLFRAGVTPVAICGAVADSIERQYRVRPHIIPNGIPVAVMRSGAAVRARWRQDNAVPDDALVFVALGRLVPAKNLRDAIDAFALASRGVPGSVFLVAGDGPMREALAAHARARGVGDRVRLLGIRDDVPNLLGAADVVVSSSVWEGHPLSTLEAMAAGRPVVAYGVGGIPEIVADGVSGVIVASGDVAALAAGMVRLADPAERGRMGEAAAARAEREFDVSTMARAYESVYYLSLARRDDGDAERRAA